MCPPRVFQARVSEGNIQTAARMWNGRNGRFSSPHNVANIVQREKSMPTHSLENSLERMKMIDNYVARKYFEVNIEYTISCLGSTFWSITNIIHTSQLLPFMCLQSNTIFFYFSFIVASLNLADILTLFLVVNGPKKRKWRDRIFFLQFVVGIKLVLVAFNFLLSLASCFPSPCGLHLQMSCEANMPSHFWAGSLVAGLRWYDVRLVGVYHLCASVNQCISAMLLCIKWNDLKMYVLWRLRKLESYIQDLFIP